MDIKERIREAQARIITNLAKCETLIAELYEEFSRSDAELAHFWLNISTEEVDHASKLKSLLTLLDKGVIFREIGRFDAPSINPMLERVGKELEAARRAPPSRKHALQTALDIETTVFDAHFYDVVHADSPEYQAIASQLKTETHRHADLVQGKLLEAKRLSGSTPE